MEAVAGVYFYVTHLLCGFMYTVLSTPNVPFVCVLYVHVSLFIRRTMRCRALCLECRVSWVRVPPEAAPFFRKSDYLGCAVLLCVVVCLTLLASFFLPSHLSLKHDILVLRKQLEYFQYNSFGII